MRLKNNLFMVKSRIFSTLLVPTLVMVILFVPWLGEMYFYSKGEPREAIVAMTMLDSGNWILPVSHGADIPYKPPFLAWLIAIVSLIFNGGVVSEFTSRLPSAIAGVGLLVATWRIVASRVDKKRAWLTMLVLATSFEVFRACSACRVDMLLTMCMVGGIYAIYTMKGRPLRAFWAVLLLSGATLTKGPVGTLLPCLAMGIFELLQRKNFFKVFFKLLLLAVGSFIIPAGWYYLAYRQGGDNFAARAWEENIGRMTGSMGYASHLNPWYYNVVTILAGMLPWTIPVVLSLTFGKFRTQIKETVQKKRIGSFAFLSLTVGLTAFIFYCFPASKRSVYLLPCYPFIAYGVAWIISGAALKRLMRVWEKILAILAVIVPIALITLSYLNSGLKMEHLQWYQWIPGLLPVAVGLSWLVKKEKVADGVYGSLLITYALLIAYSGAFAPILMNARSDIKGARKITAIVPADAEIKTYISGDSLMRYYTINFYLKDRLRLAEDTLSRSEWLLTGTLSPEDTVSAITVSEKSCDTRKPVYLLRPRSR